ncbi:MAG: universal stress protein [Halobacteriota archaeon]
MDRDVLLVPIANPASASRLVDTATDLARELDLAIDVLHVVRVPPQVPLSQASVVLESDTGFVFGCVDELERRGLDATARIRYARSISRGIITACEDSRVTLGLLGWRGRPQRRDVLMGSYLDNVVNRAPCDILVERIDEGERRIDSMLVPVAGGPHVELALVTAEALAHQHHAGIEIVHVVEPDPEADAVDRATGYLGSAAATLDPAIDVTQTVLEDEDVVAAIVEAGRSHDLTLLGAAEEGIISQLLFGEIPERVGRASTSGVILAKRNLGLSERLSGLRRWVARLR